MAKDIKSLISDIAEELEEEAVKLRSPEEVKLHSTAQRLLLLERDLRAPGAARSTEDRTTALLEAIAKEDF